MTPTTFNARKPLMLAGTSIFLFALTAVSLAQVQGPDWGFANDPAANQRQVKFDGGGRMLGSGGCNRFSASYELSGGKLTVGPIVATRRACPEDVMKREDEFFRLLQSTRAVVAEKDQLALKAEDGTVLATLTRLPKE